MILFLPFLIYSFLLVSFKVGTKDHILSSPAMLIPEDLNLYIFLENVTSLTISYVSFLDIL